MFRQSRSLSISSKYNELFKSDIIRQESLFKLLYKAFIIPSIVQLLEAKHILKQNNDTYKGNKINKDYNNFISKNLIKKTKKADRIMNGMKNSNNQNKLEEKIAKIKNEIPIKTKYEIYLEEEKNKNGNNINDKEEMEKKNDLENNGKVKDWWGGIFT